MVYKKDKDITHLIPAYRRMLAHITPNRQAAQVYFRQTMEVSKTLAWTSEVFEKTGKKISMMHLFIAAVGRVFHDHPNLNRYVSGTRFYQRDGVYFSASAKKELKNGSKIVLVKIKVEPGMGPIEVHDALMDKLKVGRSDQKMTQEKEMDLILKFPNFMVGWLTKFAMWLDRHHLLPGFMADPDPLFTSLIVGNLGSIGLDAGYHHLYEFGNSPFFAMLGRKREEVVTQDGKPVTKIFVENKYTFDERIEDGLACAFGLAAVKELIQDPTRFETGIKDWKDTPPEVTAT
jgi:hypothetical protein